MNQPYVPAKRTTAGIRTANEPNHFGREEGGKEVFDLLASGFGALSSP